VNRSERVVVGMDPHKRSATIEVVTSDETVLGAGRLAAARRSASPTTLSAAEAASKEAGATSGRDHGQDGAVTHRDRSTDRPRVVTAPCDRTLWCAARSLFAGFGGVDQPIMSEFDALRALLLRWIPEIMAEVVPVRSADSAHSRVAALWQTIGWVPDFADVVANPDPVEAGRRVRKLLADWATAGEVGGRPADRLPAAFRLVDLSMEHEEFFSITDEDGHDEADPPVLIGTASCPELVAEGLTYHRG
jgi:hypothetical protein